MAARTEASGRTEFERQLDKLKRNGPDSQNVCIETFTTENVRLPDPLLGKLTALLSIKYLKKLKLSGNQILQTGAQKLAESLKSNQHLEVLDLSKNPLTDNGVVALASAFKFNKTLKELILRKCSFTGDGAAKLGDMLRVKKDLRVLDVSENAIGNEGTRDICHGIIESTVEGIASQLVRLHMNGCVIGDEGAKHIGTVISTVANLRKVNLGHNEIGQHGAHWVALGLLKKNIATTDDFSLEGVEWLNLDYNEIGDEGVKLIANVLPANHTIKNLSLVGVGMRQQGLALLCEKVAETNVIETLSIAKNDIEKNTVVNSVLNMLNGMDTLTVLDLSGISLSLEDVKTLGDALSSHLRCRLHSLYLSDCNIDNEGAYSIAQGIRNNTDLKTLDVTSNSFGAHGAKCFAKVFERAKNLKEFYITGASKIGAEGENYLARALKVNQNINIRGASSELDYLSDFTRRNMAFNDDMTEWSEEAWIVVKRGAGAIIGTVLSLMDKEELAHFKKHVLYGSKNVVQQNMFEFILRHSESPMMDTVSFFVNKLGVDWDEDCKSRASAALANRHVNNKNEQTSDDVTYRYIAKKYCKDERVKALTQDSDLFLNRYKKAPGPASHQTSDIRRYQATDLAADTGRTERVFVQIYEDDADFRREKNAREDMLHKLKAAGPFAIYDTILRERDYHDDSACISFDGCIADLRDSVENLGVCAGFDIQSTIYLAKTAAECLGTVNNLDRVHGDFRPRNFFLVAREREGDDPKGGKKRVKLPNKWVLFDFSKSVPHGTKVTLRADSAYLPPEVARITFNTKFHEKQLPFANEKMDVWAFGVTLYQLLTGQHLFHTENATDRLYRKRERSELMNWICLDDKRQKIILHRAHEAIFPNESVYNKIKTSAKDLVVWCLQGNPHNRPSFNQILKHPFFDYKKTVQYQDTDLLLSWYKELNLDAGTMHSKNGRTHAHIINTQPKECREISRSLLAYYRAAGCHATTDTDDWKMDIKARRELVDKSQCLVVLVTEDCFFRQPIMRKLLWAMDCTETSAIIFIDASTAATRAPKLVWAEFFKQWSDEKNKKFAELFDSLYPVKENLALKNIHIGHKKKHLKSFLQTEVRSELERLSGKLMPYRTRPFQGQAMVDEMFVRSGFYPASQTKSINARAPKTDDKSETIVLILWNELSGNQKIRMDAMKLRMKMMGLNKGNGNNKIEIIGSPEQVYNYFDQDEGDLKAKSPTVIISLISYGFYKQFSEVLSDLSEAHGAISSIPVAYNEWDPASREALEEISNTGFTSKSLLETLKNPNSYIPLPSTDTRALEYEMNASLTYILEKSSEKLAVSKRNVNKQEDNAYVRYEPNQLFAAY